MYLQKSVQVQCSCVHFWKAAAKSQSTNVLTWLLRLHLQNLMRFICWQKDSSLKKRLLLHLLQHFGIPLMKIKNDIHTTQFVVHATILETVQLLQRVKWHTIAKIPNIKHVQMIWVNKDDLEPNSVNQAGELTLHMVFLDPTNAFGCIPHQLLWMGFD